MKKMFKENRNLFIILMIALVCIIISALLLFKYFYFGNGQSKYGSRLQGIENVIIEDIKKSEVATYLEEDSKVTSAKVEVTGKIVYIKINFNNEATLTEAKTIAVKSLDKFSEEEKNFYDFSFTLYQESSENVEGFRIMGAKNVNGTNLVWNNNNATKTVED